jgi:hypothetical protein
LVADCVTALPEIWSLVALHLGLVGAWRLMLVCKAARVGAKDFLKTLPGLVVSGGKTPADGGRGVDVKQVWRLDLATLQWEPMPSLVYPRCHHACCAVRGGLVVYGGDASDEAAVSGSVEMLLVEGQGAFTSQPPLSRGETTSTVAIAVDESGSAVGRALLLGGYLDGDDPVPMSTVSLVDLATGVCTPQPNLLHARCQFAAVQLPDGGVVCTGGYGSNWTKLSSAEVLVPFSQGVADATWTWRGLPAMSVARAGCRGCVLSDGRFAVLGGDNGNGDALSSCEALTAGQDERWEPLPPMLEARSFHTCVAVADSMVVAGGYGCTQLGLVLLNSAEVFDEVLCRWLRLPYDLPYDNGIYGMGSALL